MPRQNSTGGKDRLGRISKQGDHYLRWLLVAGAMAVIRQAKRRDTANPWLAGLIAHKPTKVVAVALANKIARVAWVLLRRWRNLSKAGCRGRGLSAPTNWRRTEAVEEFGRVNVR